MLSDSREHCRGPRHARDRGGAEASEGVSSAMAAQGISTRGRPRNNRMFGKVLPERLTTDSAVRERRCGRSLVEIPCIGIARESRSGCFDSSFFLRFAQSESLSMTGVEGVVLLVDSGLGYGLSFQHDGGQGRHTAPAQLALSKNMEIVHRLISRGLAQRRSEKWYASCFSTMIRGRSRSSS